jgi:L-threonylcarbamoyladenylate synthase
MQEQINKAIEHLNKGDVILYPTDTIIGLGCDATNTEAVKKIIDIKERPSSKSFVLLVANDRMLNSYVKEVPELAWDLMDCSEKPVTIIYSNPKNLPEEILAQDGSIAIRVVREGFCNKLIFKYNKPLVSTSANLSNAAAPSRVKEVSNAIKNHVDYIVDLQSEGNNKASSIIKLGVGGEVEIIRK